MKSVLLLAAVLMFSNFTFAMDPVAKDAISQTQKDMKDPVARKKMLDTPQAKNADAAAANLAGDSKNLDEMYGISAELIGIIGEQSQGDPKKMQEALDKAQKDPAGFLKSLPPEQQEKIRQLSKKIEDGKGKKSRP